MRRNATYTMLCGAAAMIVMGTAGHAAAQVTVRAQLYWAWSDGAWRPHRYDWDARDGRYSLPGAGLWFSVGYLPPPGYCREWIPGVPRAYQPPPVPCARLFLPYGYARANVLIIGSPGYDGPRIGLRFARGERERFERERTDRERRAWDRRSWDRRSRDRSAWDRGSRDRRAWDRGTWDRGSRRERSRDARSSDRGDGRRGHGHHGRG